MNPKTLALLALLDVCLDLPCRFERQAAARILGFTDMGDCMTNGEFDFDPSRMGVSHVTSPRWFYDKQGLFDDLHRRGIAY